MAEFRGQDLRGSRFEKTNLEGAVFREVDLSGARVRNVVLSDVVIRGAWVRDLEIDGDVQGLVVNGVEVGPFVAAELERRYPELAGLRPTTADGCREIWPLLERQWAETVARARGLPEELLHERVDGEWSFIETLRHLLFATDAWVGRALLGEPSPYHPLGLPHDEMEQIEGVPWDRAARPSLEEVLALREDRMACVRTVIAELTDERLAGETEPVLEPGYPESRAFPVARCLGAVLNEEWWHRRFAERDLDILEAQRTGGSQG